MNIVPLIGRMREEFAAVEKRLAEPDVFDDRQGYERLARQHQRLSQLLAHYDELEGCRRELGDNRAMLNEEEDTEFLEMVAAEIERLERRVTELDTAVTAMLLPPDAHTGRNTIIEIRPAAGGDESALFAGDLLRMYMRFAERRGWRVELLSRSETDLGGMKDVSCAVQGQDVFRYLRFESGVHRVQRVPVTETSGRIHTSTVTVAVLPEAREVEIEIGADDLRIEVFRSSGPGGQHVNTTDSAVRITHIPSGVSVASQQEKSQHRNREIAMRILRARLLEAQRRRDEAAYAAKRRSQIGSGDRSERIRTYNFPQNRITDHRYGLSWHDLPGMLDGNLDSMFAELLAADTRRRLEQELEQSGE